MSVQTDIDARTAKLQKILTDTNAALVEKDGHGAADLSGVPAAVLALEAKSEITLEDVYIEPTEEEQTVYPSEGFDGISSVTVGAVEAGGGGGNISVPSQYQSYVEAAKAIYTGPYANIAIAENDTVVSVLFLLDSFTVTSYDAATTNYAASGHVNCTVNKETGTWTMGDYSTEASPGGNYAKNIKYSSACWYYNGSVIWPISSGGGDSFFPKFADTYEIINHDELYEFIYSNVMNVNIVYPIMVNEYSIEEVTG